MEPPTQPYSEYPTLINAAFSASDYITLIVGLLIIVLLVAISALIASSENAFFSLSKAQSHELTDDKTATASASKYLLDNPKKLLATILIANTFVNISVVMVSSLILPIVFNFEAYPWIGFAVEIIFITFMIVLFGEVIPKIYASQNNMKVARVLAIPMYYLGRMLGPFVWVLVRSTSVIDKRITKKGHVLSVHELTHAIEITSEADAPKEEKRILKSIVNFGNINVRQIMRQRPDISALDASLTFAEVLDRINTLGYSRMPVYKDNLDNITGILYIKDLLPHIEKEAAFKWTSLVRKPYFVPESKKIDDLLKEFQSKRVHVAVVVDEYGGSSGLVTMEDILEEIFGEINDEFDEDEHFFSRINDHTFLFEAKILIHDMCKHMGIEPDQFDEIKNDADTLGGLLLELSEELPETGEQLIYGRFTFVIEAVDKRRIKRVKVIIGEEDAQEL